GGCDLWLTPISGAPGSRALSLFANNRHGNFSPMRCSAMFEQKDALPRAELHSSVSNRYCLTCVRQCHPDVRRHIIAAFRTVCEVIGILGNQPVKKLFQIAAGGRIGVFHDEKAATGMLNTYRHSYGSNSARVDPRLHIIGDFVQSFYSGAHFELLEAAVHMQQL